MKEYQGNKNINFFLKDFIGKSKLIENLKIYIESSKIENRNLDHVLIYGPPGTGKSTLAKIIANEMSYKIKVIQGPSLNQISDILNIFYSIKQFDLILIDEIDCIDRKCFEMFYEAIESFQINISVGKELNSKVIKMELPKFTLIGLTNKLGNIPQPLIDRFGIIFKLDIYEDHEIEQIININCLKMGITISQKMKKVVCINSKGNPRICLNILKRVKDFHNCGIIDDESIINRMELALNGIGVEELRYLKVLESSKKSLSLKSISSMIDSQENTVINIIEPFLIKREFINKSSSGRKITEKGLLELKKMKNNSNL